MKSAWIVGIKVEIKMIEEYLFDVCGNSVVRLVNVDGRETVP